ncbi:MAG: FAD-dependent oxidoreductase [Alphaproteobacteria bacterium]|nr:FAD-dependent oxidoreductase [Alphaproteobacteria bacterium]
MSRLYLNKAQLNAETEKCLQCPAKPCLHACPVRCSPCDFIAAAKENDYAKAAELIRTQNPLGEICGLICPDKFCVKACARQNIDQAIRIPAVQATIMKAARENNFSDTSENVAANGVKVAVVGLGPAGIGAIAELLKYGFSVSAFEKEKNIGGALNLIPPARLPREILDYEWQQLAAHPLLDVRFNSVCPNYAVLLEEGYNAVIVAVGEQKPRRLGIEGEDLAISYTSYLKNPAQYPATGHILIIGGGEVAVDCAVTAAQNGAEHVEMLVRRRVGDMRVTLREQASLFAHNIDITSMTRLTRLIKETDGTLTAFTIKTTFAADGRLVDVADTEIARRGLERVVLALGSTRAEETLKNDNILYAGDFINGGSTAVEAIASGKYAARKIIDKFTKI